MHYAEVAINVPVNKTFHYHIPEELAPLTQIGSLVRVEFGVAMQPAIVLALHDTTDIPETKPILEVVSDTPVLPPAYVRLGYWLSETYMESIGYCIWTMLPPGLIGKGNYDISLKDPDADPRGSLQTEIVEFLRENGTQRMTVLKKQFKGRSLNTSLARLVELGIVEKKPFLMSASIKRKKEHIVKMTFPGKQIANISRNVGKSVKKADLLEFIARQSDTAIPVDEALLKAGVKSRSVLNHLVAEGLVTVNPSTDEAEETVTLKVSQTKVDEVLMDWRESAPYLQILHHVADTPNPLTVSEIMDETSGMQRHINKLVSDGLIELSEMPVWRDSLSDRDFYPKTAPKLTPDQQAVWDVIHQAIEAQDNLDQEVARFLLHGVTGSGKTELYLRAIDAVIQQGKRAIFLVPEIALTSQTIRRVAERFPDQVAIYHGSLPREEKYDTWQRARAGEINIIVGTRSALFTPLPDVGLIILDEEHSPSYKQTPPEHEQYLDANLAVIPYHARDVAEKLMQSRNGTVILGSATPDIATYYRAQKGHYEYLHLPQRIMGHRQRIAEQAKRIGVTPKYQPESDDALHIGLPPVTVVDMRSELRSGNTSMFSRDLQDGLKTVLERGEQAMLLLNRRGQSTYVFCRDCGYVVMCDRCDSPMTHHRQGEQMRCHHCGYSHPTPQTCPSCESKRIKFFGAGTQQVEQALKKLYPDVRTLRWDADTVSKPELHHEILQRFINREADIVIGTQMIAKGLDLPLVTLVGVVSADLGLALPDYRAGERVFQLLTQVAGRAGRGILGGKVILQTYQPGHYVMQFASQHDYLGFVDKELAYRREMGYPPFRRLARLLFQFHDFYKAQKQAEEGARRVKHLLDKHGMTGTELIGPAPCFFTRIDRHYRWHLLLRGPNPAKALGELRMEQGWQLDIDPVDVL